MFIQGFGVLDIEKTFESGAFFQGRNLLLLLIKGRSRRTAASIDASIDQKCLFYLKSVVL